MSERLSGLQRRIRLRTRRGMQVGPEERPEESSEPGKSRPRFNFGALTAVLSEPINMVLEIPDEIVPGLYLGSMMAEMNYRGLQAVKITHVLCVASGLRASHLGRLAYKQVPMADSEAQNLLTHLDSCFDFIDGTIAQGGRVFVHCAAGVSRSAAVVIAYLMWKEHMPLKEALKFVRSRRGIVSPNPGFLCQLRIFEENGFDTTKEKVQWNFSNFTEMARTGEMARLHRELMSQMP